LRRLFSATIGVTLAGSLEGIQGSKWYSRSTPFPLRYSFISSPWARFWTSFYNWCLAEKSSRHLQSLYSRVFRPEARISARNDTDSSWFERQISTQTHLRSRKLTWSSLWWA